MPTNRGGELSPINARWLATRAETIDSVVWTERIRREHTDLWRSILRSLLLDDVAGKVLRWLALHGEEAVATYDELTEVVPGRSRRTIRLQVGKLREAEVLQTTDTRPTQVAFATPAAYLLTTDTLSILEDW